MKLVGQSMLAAVLIFFSHLGAAYAYTFLSFSKGPFDCDNGKVYEIRGQIMYVNGQQLPENDPTYYMFWRGSKRTYIDVYENGVPAGRCNLAIQQ